MVDEASAGDNVGLTLHGVDQSNIIRGMVVAEIRSIKPYTIFQAKVNILLLVLCRRC